MTNLNFITPTSQEIVAYLQSKGLKTRVEGDQIITNKCPFCGKDKEDWTHFYISPKGLYFCHKCGTSGNIITLAKFYNDYTKPEIEPLNGSNSRGLSETVKSPQELEKPKEEENKGPSEADMKRYQTSVTEYHKTLFEKKDDKNSIGGQVYDYLTITRGLKPETLEHFKIGWTGTSISIPIFENGKVVNIRYRGNPFDVEATKMMNVKGGKMVLFNGDVLKDAKKVVITEGEIDAMSLYQEGWENVVSITCGAQTFKQEWADAMQKVNSIYLCYDNDDAGVKGNLLAVEKLGASRCRMIEIPKEAGKDLNDFFAVKKKTVDDFNALYNSAKKISVESEHIKEIKEVAKLAMEEMKNPNVLRGMSTGWKLLDDLWKGMRDGNLIVISGDTGVGKCHAKGTKVLMYDGSLKKVEDIKIGDKLMGPDSTSRTVLKLARGREKMWKVEPKKGAENFVVNRNHLLHLKKNTKKYPHYPDTIDITVDNWVKFPSKRKHVYFLEHSKAIKFKEKKLSLEPYFLGLWLGDGTSSGPCITSADSEIEKYLKSYANRLGLQLVAKNQPNNKSRYYCLTREKKFEGVNKTHKGKYIYPTGKKGYGSAISLLNILQKEKLINNKHIPISYKINSEKNRLELLAGLIDSDGNKEKVGYSFSNKNKQLCEDVIFLARSLGFFASTLKERTTTCLGKEFKSYRIYISGDVKRIPLKVKRKIVKKGVTDINWLTTRFRLWEFPVGDYYGFSLDKDQLYILDNFIINHNTFFTQNMVMNIVNHKDENKADDPIPVMYFSLEQTPEEIAERFMMLQGNIRQSELIKKDAKGEFSKLEEVYNGLATKPIYLYSGYEKIDMQLLGSVSEKAVKDFGCRIIFIDHLHFFATGDRKNRTIEISDIVRYCKLLARKLMVPIVLVCHIKKLENDNDKPTMEALKDSSAIKQDADIVALLWRKRMANREQEKWARINTDKNRHGKSGERFFIVDENTCRFEESLYGPTESKDTQAMPDQDSKIAKPPMNIPEEV